MKSGKILVTGGNGFIGKHLVNRLVGLGHQVTVLDNFSASQENDPSSKIEMINIDISDPALVKTIMKIRPQTVYHLAADNRVIGSVESILKSNVVGTFNVLEACRQAGIKQFIFTSSAAVYGDSRELPIKETWPTRPISAYGISKLTDELYCQLFKVSFISTIFRFANVYGPGQNSSAEGGVVAIFIKRILEGSSVIVYGNGRQTRDFVFVGDVVDALVAALAKPIAATLNIGSNWPTSIMHLVKTIEKLTGKSARINFYPKRPVEIDKSLFSYNQAQQLLRWQPKTSLEKGIDDTINSYLTGV